MILSALSSAFYNAPLFLPSVGPMEMVVVFVVVLILFGPGKLPDVFKALGTGVRQFKEASRSVTHDEHHLPPTAVSPQVPAQPQAHLPENKSTSDV